MYNKKWFAGGRKKFFFIMAAVLSCLLIICIVLNFFDTRKERYGTVRIIPEKPDTVSVGYRIEADLKVINDRDFFSDLHNLLAEQWKWWNEKDRTEQTLSSFLPGYCTLNSDTWETCEKTIGFALENPLESCDWLEIADHMGIALDKPAVTEERKHTKVGWHGSGNGDIFGVDVTSGYLYDDIRVILTVTGHSKDDSVYETGNYWSEDISLEIEDYTMKNKNTAKLVTILGTERYKSIHAYFIQDGMLYKIHVTGDPNRETEVREVMERILKEFK